MTATEHRSTALAHDSPPVSRLPLLDVLRGTAILGTLATNVWLFTAPLGEVTPLYSTELTVSASGVGQVVESVFRFLANGKFLALLAILFGAGLAIQYGSAARRGRRWPGTYLARALFLLVEGALHFVLVFAWDVLMGYAVTGLVVAWLLTRSPRTRRIVLWTAATGHVLFMTLVTAALATANVQEPSARETAELTALYAEGSYLGRCCSAWTMRCCCASSRSSLSGCWWRSSSSAWACCVPGRSTRTCPADGCRSGWPAGVWVWGFR